MKFFFTILLTFLIIQEFSSLFGQFPKPKGSFLPPKIIGNVSASQKNILIKTLEENLSTHFIFSKSIQDGIDDTEIQENLFQMQIIENKGEIQLVLDWLKVSKRSFEKDICIDCKTFELNQKVIGIVENLLGIGGIDKDPLSIVKEELRIQKEELRIQKEELRIQKEELRIQK